MPDGDELRIHLKGELAEMLALSTNKKPGSKGTGLKTTLVAGVGFEPTTFRLWVSRANLRAHALGTTRIP